MRRERGRERAYAKVSLRLPGDRQPPSRATVPPAPGRAADTVTFTDVYWSSFVRSTVEKSGGHGDGPALGAPVKGTE